MDMTDSLIAKSNQLNALDLVEPRTFTIEKITQGSAEQPFDFHLKEIPGRPYRPSKGMRRVIAHGWGAKDIGETYPGRRLTLYCDHTVRWAGAPVGGIRVSHMSNIGKAFEMPLAESKQKRITYRVEPLADLPAAVVVNAEQVAASSSIDELRSLYSKASPDVQALILARVEVLKALVPVDPVVADG